MNAIGEPTRMLDPLIGALRWQTVLIDSDGLIVLPHHVAPELADNHPADRLRGRLTRA